MVRPMLAKVWEPRHWCPDGMFVQPKLNGIRAMYKGGRFMSRDGILWHNSCLGHLREMLQGIPPEVILDGELYIHGMSLQQINARVAVMRVEPHPDECSVTYCVFDHVSDEGFAIRNSYLNLLWRTHIEEHHKDGVVLVQTCYIGNQELGDHSFLHYKHQGYEGMMYRHPTAPYSLPDSCSNKENRSKHLLKRKTWCDLDADILAVYSGSNRLSDTCGSIYCRHIYKGKPRYFSVGTGISDLQRAALWSKRIDIANDADCGQPWRIKIQYEMLSDDGIPLKPVILLIPNLV
jgi:ATP-dependent DNA ligase